MFVVSNFVSAIAAILDIALQVYFWIIIVRALISWVNPDPWNPIVQFLTRATEPVLAPVRRLLPTWRTGIDFSPLLVLLAIYFVRIFLVGTLMDFARSIR